MVASGDSDKLSIIAVIVLKRKLLVENLSSTFSCFTISLNSGLITGAAFLQKILYLACD